MIENVNAVADDIIQPTPRQLARIEARQRFDRLYVYLPIGVLVLAMLVVMGVMLSVIFTTEDFTASNQAQLMSGLADLIMIGAILPLILVASILPLSFVGIMVYLRQKRQAEETEERGVTYGRFQTLLWKLEGYLDTAGQKITEVTPVIAKPIIQFNMVLSYLEAIFNQIFRRSEINE